MNKGLKRLLVSAGTLIVAFLALEAGLRVAGVEPLAGVPTRWFKFFLRPSDDPVLVYELNPGTAGYAWGCEVEINSLGFRGPEVTPEKPAGTKRIACVGDSVTFGIGVPVEEAFAAGLQARLENDGTPVEVLNLGVGGYDTLQGVTFLERVGLPREPDRILFTHCFNDLGRVTVSRSSIEALERYRSWPYRSRVVQWLGRTLERREWERELEVENREEVFRQRYGPAIADLEADAEQMARLARVRGLLPEEPELRKRHAMLAWYALPERVGKLRHAFERLAQLGRTAGVPVTVVVVPHLAEEPLQAAYEVAYEVVAHEARRVGMEVVDLRESFRALDRDVRLNPADDTHFDATGHALVADELARHLAATGFPGG